jgi:hypothetical protein
MINALANHPQLDNIISHLDTHQGTTFSCKDIKRELFKDNDQINEDIIKIWIEYIANSKLKLTTVGQISNNGRGDSNFLTTIKWTGVIPNFIISGGFKKQHEIDQAAKKRQAEKEEREFEKLEYDAKLSKWKFKTFWFVFFGGFIGGLMGATSLILELEGRGYITLPIELRQSRPAPTDTLSKTTNTTELPKKFAYPKPSSASRDSSNLISDKK